jgi:SAM-dependent methyltransferase
MKFICRACGCTDLTSVVLLENMPLTDDFISIDTTDRKEYIKNINIFECLYCGLVQNPADFDHEGYYQDYQYSSGHSTFVQNFMQRYAKVVCDVYEQFHHKHPTAVLEIGSGDGEQLKHFKSLSVTRVLGIEPSEYLAQVASESGIPTQVDLFGAHTKDKLTETFDVCISSYTLDHVRSPNEYLQTAYTLLKDGGILTFEVHNLEKIIQRTEYCLFEHEHTIYLTPDTASKLIRSQGFEVISINPIPSDEVRGNSLIVIAKKNALHLNMHVSNQQLHNQQLHNQQLQNQQLQNQQLQNQQLQNLDDRIKTTVVRIDAWIDSLPITADLVGFGAGGRGVMTLAALNNSKRFKAVFDSNYDSNRYLTPKTRIPIVGSDSWGTFADAYCVIFSFGYFKEIKNQLIKNGFSEDKIFSLENFFPSEGND